MPKSMRQARVALPVAYQGIPRRFGRTRPALVAAVVEIVSVAAPAAPAMFTGLVEPKLRVGGY
jgi:hypothetical protein